MNKSLQKKRAARLAAVQALYHRSVMDQKGRPANRFIDDMLLQWEGLSQGKDEEWDTDITPDRSLLTRIVEGVVAEEKNLEPHVEQVIKEGWREDRMSPILTATLYCAAYELAHRTDTKVPIIVDEYTSLAAEFFDEPELGYTHSALFQLADVLRPKKDA